MPDIHEAKCLEPPPVPVGAPWGAGGFFCPTLYMYFCIRPGIFHFFERSGMSDSQRLHQI